MNGSIVYRPEFKKSSAAGYGQYNRQYEADINSYYEHSKRHEINVRNYISNRDNKDNRKRTLQNRDDLESIPEMAPSPKRRRLNC